MRFPDRADWVSLEKTMQFEGGSRRASNIGNPFAIFVKKHNQSARHIKSLISRHSHTFEKELQPSLPISVFPHSIEQVIVQAPVTLEK